MQHVEADNLGSYMIKSMMNLRYIYLCLFLGFTTITFGQVPGEISLDPVGQSFSRACPDRNAGTVSLGTFIGQSNDIALNRSFLCLNDRLNFEHNGDAEVLDSDPNAATTPGIGYAWYTCPPSVPRPNLGAVLLDPCLLTDPAPTDGIYVYVDEINGDALFQNGNQINGRSIPDFFNNGEPIEVWFAPITIDAVSPMGTAVFEGMPTPGPCVHVNTAAAFSIVYLTPMQSQRRTVISDGAGGCFGSFEIYGGLPQFDNTQFYTITVESVDAPGTFATLQSGTYGHGDQVNFAFMLEGRYRVTVEDSKSCLHEFEMDVRCTNPVTFNIGSVSANMGDVVCFDVTLEGFVDMGTTSFDLVWNPNVFEYVSNTGFSIDADPLASIVDNRSNEGRLRVLWLARNLLIGQTEPDGTTFFQVCLRAIGECGEETPIFLDGNVIVTDFNNNDLAYLVNDGLAEINVGSVSALSDVCPDDGTGTGSIKLTMCGGVAPYGIVYVGPNGGGGGSISEPNGMQSIEDLPAGNYDFTITDATGAMTNVTVIVPSGTIHQIEVGVDNPTCSYSANGTIGVGISPAGSYEIEWSTNEYNTDTIRLVSNGQYRVTVTDGNGCAVSGSVTMNTEPIRIISNVTDARCLSSSDGRIDATAQGGTPFAGGYRFDWPGFPPNITFNSSFVNRTVGDYLLTVSDSNNCFTNEVISITSNRAVQVDDVTITHNTCFGGQAGGLRIETSTANAPAGNYLYEWSRGGMDVSSLFANGPNFSQSSSLPAGRYDVTITDFNQSLGCTLDTFFIITQPAEILIELVSSSPETCAGNDGRITVRATGGSTEPGALLLYQWLDPGTSNGVAAQDGLVAGRYTVTIIQTINGNLVGCSVDTFFDLTQLPGPEILRFDSVSVSCGGGMDGELEIFYVQPPPGETYNVNWTDDNGMNYSGDVITGLSPGTYYVTVSADVGCESMDTVRLGESRDITLDSVLYRIPTCPNSGNGNIRVFASGPGSVLHYAWSHPNGSDNNTLPSVGVGTYSVTITTEGSNCPPLVIDTLMVRKPDIFTGVFSGIMGATCPGICNGAATINATGGMGTIRYMWSNAQTTASANGLCAGSNFVVVSDDLCADTFFINIPAADTIGLMSEQADPTCFGDMDGFIRITPSGSNPPFNVLWNDGPMIPDRNGLGVGTYISTVTDMMGCMRMDTFVLTTAPALTATIEPTDLLQITCAGRDDGRATVTVTGGNGGNSYTWNPNISQSSEVGNLAPGNYSVTVTDMAGCTDNASFIISEPAAIQFVLGDQSQIQCFGERAAFTVDTAYSGAGGPYSYTINSGARIEIGETINLFGGQYVVTVIDSTGCFIDSTITIVQPAEFSVDIGEDITVNLGDSARLALVSVSGAFPIDSFIWTSSGDNLSCMVCPSPWITPFQESLVTLLAVDSTGCTATDDLTVFVDARRKVYIPTAFSPNNDGINDNFQVFSGIGVTRIETMNIYNRWGDKVFEDRNLPADRQGSGGWDGMFKGKQLNPDIYIYVIEALFADGKVIVYKGEVQLVR